MYSPLIVDRKLHAIRHNPKSPYPNLQFRSIDESLTITKRLTAKLYSPSPENKRLESMLDAKEMDWIRQEILLCRLSFNYCAERYLFAEIEGGGHAPAIWWQSQLRALELISKREESNHADYAKYQFSEGIRVVWHKTRQQGATALARLMAMHRASLYKTTRGVTASLDEDKVNELYKRDKIVWDNLPFYLKPNGLFTLQDKPTNMEYDTKAQAWKMAEPIKSTMLYQMANQQAGVGTGQQFDVSLFTELALWPLAERIQFDFLPAVPQLLNTLVGFESTANGRTGWWYEFTEAIRAKDIGFERWIYVFTPWYINSHKNRLIPPDGWEPSDKTKEHYELIVRTSQEFAGFTIRPKRENLYWWESEYELNRKLGTLNIFFSNYPATPEQSFQHAASSAYPIEVIDWIRSTTQLGMPYYIEAKSTGFSISSQQSESTQDITPSITDRTSYADTYTVGTIGKLVKMNPTEYDKDPRGIVWIWEPPVNGATYIMGLDISVGVTGWNRYSRVNSDKKTNNGSVEIIRVGTSDAKGNLRPDKQVCEFAAPVDPADLGYIANVLGRLYRGKEEDQCLCIGEITGPGSSTLRTMTECGYLNHWMWQYYGDLIPTESRKVWWSATPTSLKDLWIKCSRHVTRKQVLVKSPWLAEECVDARYDPDRMYAYSPNNFKGHGDRMRAFYLALWGANGWSMELERTQEAVSTQAEVVDPQLTDMSMEEMYDRWGGMTW